MNAIFKRRSVRQFSKQKVEPEKMRTLLKAAMQAPSAGNQRPWEFIVVQDRDKLNELSRMSPYAGPIAEAPAAIILITNQTFLKYPENQDQDMSAAAENILIEAVELGLGAVWLNAAPLNDRVNYIKTLFSLDDHLMPFAVIPVGYPLDNPAVSDRFEESRIHYEIY